MFPKWHLHSPQAQTLTVILWPWPRPSGVENQQDLHNRYVKLSFLLQQFHWVIKKGHKLDKQLVRIRHRWHGPLLGSHSSKLLQKSKLALHAYHKSTNIYNYYKFTNQMPINVLPITNLLSSSLRYKCKLFLDGNNYSARNYQRASTA